MTSLHPRARKLAMAALFAGASFCLPAGAWAQTKLFVPNNSPQVSRAVQTKDGVVFVPDFGNAVEAGPAKATTQLQASDTSAVAGPVPTPNPDVPAQPAAE